MAIVKNTNSNYVINTPRGVSSNITLNSDAVIIPGNLTVLGATTAVETNNTVLKDNIIVLNDGETGAGVTAGSAGIAVNRGSLSNVQIRWTEMYGGKWQITNDGTTYANIVSSNVAATYLTTVYDDKTPQLGGDLNVGANNIYSSTGNVMIGLNGVGANVGFYYSPGIPPSPPISNITAIYAQPPGAGGSGLYTVDSRSQNDELITKRRAIGFSLLL